MDKIAINAKESAMLLELLTKAAATGPDAAVLASCYAKVKAANDRLNPKKAPPGGAS
jgi:hypothetical protein